MGPIFGKHDKIEEKLGEACMYDLTHLESAWKDNDTKMFSMDTIDVHPYKNILLSSLDVKRSNHFFANDSFQHCCRIAIK